MSTGTCRLVYMSKNETPTSWSVPCRKCGQVGYTPCLTPAGKRRRVSHIDRVRDNH
jgi:hypothetical protein